MNARQITASREMLNRYNAPLWPLPLVLGVIKSSRFKHREGGTSETCRTCAEKASAPEHMVVFWSCIDRATRQSHGQNNLSSHLTILLIQCLN